MKRTIICALGMLAMAFSAHALAQAEAQKPGRVELSQAATDTLKALFPGEDAVIPTTAPLGTRWGVKSYTLIVKTGARRPGFTYTSIRVSESGVLMQRYNHVKPEELPEAVTKALNEAMPDVQTEQILRFFEPVDQRTLEPLDAPKTYFVFNVAKDDTKGGITINEDGTIIRQRPMVKVAPKEDAPKPEKGDADEE